MGAAINHSRRAFLRGRPAATTPLRPPWSRDEAAFLDGCTRCHACRDACPQGIITMGGGGFPEIDFRRGECTFCRACVDACPQPVFLDPATTPPWNWTAAAGDACLGHQGIDCRSCADACPAGAIGFALTPRRVAVARIDAGRCTGCGACVAVCPAAAIRMARKERAP
ncbi:MAG: ferredoxin-type protein NapF [Pseudomonadota bacterium]|nr:ferredoxin-type protein NapF [Pseudomonadota bacterium]